jgi:hypothetical protein
VLTPGTSCLFGGTDPSAGGRDITNAIADETMGRIILVSIDSGCHQFLGQRTDRPTRSERGSRADLRCSASSGTRGSGPAASSRALRGWCHSSVPPPQMRDEKNGRNFLSTETWAPVRGLRPMRAERCLTENAPKPRSSARSPRASAAVSSLKRRSRCSRCRVGRGAGCALRHLNRLSFYHCVSPEAVKGSGQQMWRN